MGAVCYVVRRRPDGFVVWDSESRRTVSKHRTEAAASKAAKALNERPDERTYGVTWYCEVDAVSPEDATAKARRLLAPSYREGWEPVSVERFDPDEDGDA